MVCIAKKTEQFKLRWAARSSDLWVMMGKKLDQLDHLIILFDYLETENPNFSDGIRSSSVGSTERNT